MFYIQPLFPHYKTLPATSRSLIIKGLLVFISGHQIYSLNAFVLVAYYLFLYFVLVTMATALRLIYIFLEGSNKDSVKNDLIQTKCITWDSECYVFFLMKILIRICDKNIFSNKNDKNCSIFFIVNNWHSNCGFAAACSLGVAQYWHPEDRNSHLYLQHCCKMLMLNFVIF